MEFLRASIGKWHRQQPTAAVPDERRPRLCAIRTAGMRDAELRRAFVVWGARRWRTDAGARRDGVVPARGARLRVN